MATRHLIKLNDGDMAIRLSSISKNNMPFYSKRYGTSPIDFKRLMDLLKGSWKIEGMNLPNSEARIIARYQQEWL